MKKNYKDINFFKKIYYSVFKPSKYEELTKCGLKKSIKYVISILVILSIIYSTIITFVTNNSINNLKNYLKDNLPNLVCKDNTLSTETDERTVLDNESIINNFGGQIVVDTKTEYEELIEEYKKAEKPTILLTKNYFTIINKSGEVRKSEYNDIIEERLGKDIKKIDKDDLLYLFDNYSYTYYFIGYMLSYVIANAIIVFIYGLIIAILMSIFCKIRKVKIKFLLIYSMSLYSLTISMFAYCAMFFMVPSFKAIIQTAFAIIPIIILIKAVNTNK